VSHPELLDVLIAGAGPTGTALAIDLVRRGLSVRILDKAPHGFEGSRAKGIQPRTLEVLRDLDALDDLIQGGSRYPLLGVHLGPLTLPWPMYRQRQPSPSVPYPNTWLIPQYVTDGALRARLSRLGKEVEYSTELVAFSQDDEKVTAKVSGPQGPEAIQARFLVGAEGGSSPVRTQLGIGFPGNTDEQDRILIVDAITSGLSRNRWHVWPGSGGRFVGACPLPNTPLFQWMIRLKAGEAPPVELADINKRVQSHIRTPAIQLQKVQWRSVFRPNIRLAERYRQGRIFLAGDAAHVHTPAGAQGLNTGIQDAYNLGWKLAQVLAGAPDALLESYEAERRPIAAAVLGLSTKKYEGIAKLSPSSISRGKDESQLTLTYRDGPLAGPAHERTETLRVGDRAPDAVLSRRSGEAVRLFDLLAGPHFTAIAYGPDAERELAKLEWPSRGAALRRLAVSDTPREGDVLADSTRTFRRAYGVRSSTLFLIRPDGYLAQIASTQMLARTQAAITNLTPKGLP
jgi:2-polyprenyl-6-methoxyphenol hydroxylase-like FAD-dependent oxidoreductase